MELPGCGLGTLSTRRHILLECAMCSLPTYTCSSQVSATYIPRWGHRVSPPTLFCRWIHIGSWHIHSIHFIVCIQGTLWSNRAKMDSDKTCFDYLTIVYSIYVFPIHLNLIQLHICVHVRTLERCLTLYSCVWTSKMQGWKLTWGIWFGKAHHCSPGVNDTDMWHSKYLLVRALQG